MMAALNVQARAPEVLEEPATTARGREAPASLGTTTEFASRPCSTHFENLDSDTGEVQDGFENRFKRFALQGAARRLLPGHRVGVCLRHQRRDSDHGGVPVFRRERDHHTYFGGLMTCGNVWVCPVCAAKVSERRRADLTAAVALHRENGGSVYLLTLTVPHSKHSEAFNLVNTLLNLYRRLWSGRKSLKYLLQAYVGQVRALEVTHGENGWHPHLHVLLFFNRPIDNCLTHAQIYVNWSNLVETSGLGQLSARHGVQFQDGTFADGYISKWGIVEEVTKANVKQSRKGGRTPFALLADYLEGDFQAGALFAEFTRTFKGRSQLQWSRGLRDLLGMNIEKTDEQEAATVDALDEKIALIRDDDWKIVLRRDLRALVLEILREGTSHDLEQFLSVHRPTYQNDR